MPTSARFKANVVLCLVSVQLGIQTFITDKYISRDAIKSSLVIIQDIVKTICCIAVLLLTRNWSHVISSWSFKSSLRVALIPAIIYCTQNVLAYYAYLQLDPLVFNLINQSKVIFTAVFLKLILNKTQTTRQIIALFILFVSSLLLTIDSTTSHESKDNVNRNCTHGVIAVIIASITSGLAGTLTQKALQSESKPRNSLLFTIELSFYGVLFSGFRLYIEYILDILDGALIAKYGFFDKLDITALIPITVNGVGGIGMGLIIKYTSVLHKNYTMIAAILLNGIFRFILYSEAMSNTMYIAVPMVMLSLWLNADPNKFKQKDKSKTQ